MGWFRRSVPLEAQLAHLAEIGLTPSPGADLSTFHTRQELERKPWRQLVETLGHALEREPWTPFCDRLWMCDVERVEDDGAYREVLLRLERMTGAAVGLRDVRDHVDVEGGVAWASFTRDGRAARWDFTVDDDWLDTSVLERYAALLRESGAGLRLFGDFRNYGQVVFLAALTPSARDELVRCTKIAFEPVGRR